MMIIDLKNIENLRMQDPQDIYEVIRKIFYEQKDKVDLNKEHLWALSLNNAMGILNLELVSIGTKNRTIADPGDVFRVPLYKSSSYVVLVHNHPSGSLEPSRADIDLTNKFMKAGLLLDIPVVEHVIVTERSFFSFRMAGLIEKLERDDKYGLTFVYKKQMEKKMEELKKSVVREKKEIEARGLKKGKEAGIKEGKKELKQEIARELLILGADEKMILASTGITHQWLGRIKNEIKEKNQ